MLVGVAGIYHSSNPEYRALAVDISPASTAATLSATASEGVAAEDAHPSPANAASRAPASRLSSTENRPASRSAFDPVPLVSALSRSDAQGSGYTREEELFRMKWGWAAFDAARGEARKTAGNSNP